MVAWGIFILSLGWQNRMAEQVREVPACQAISHVIGMGHQDGSNWTRKPSREACRQLREARRGLMCALPPGFSITELQRKQAMLNASKQQATGKPKGKWGSIPLPGQFSLDYLSISDIKSNAS